MAGGFTGKAELTRLTDASQHTIHQLDVAPPSAAQSESETPQTTLAYTERCVRGLTNSFTTLVMTVAAILVGMGHRYSFRALIGDLNLASTTGKMVDGH